MSNVKNYTEQGGDVTHIGGQLVFEEGASVEGLPSSGVPVATTDTPGVVKPGDGLSIEEDGTLSVSSRGGGGGGGASGIAPIILNLGGVNLQDALRDSVNVTTSVSVSQFLRATSGDAPVVLSNIYWNDELFSCQSVACCKRTAITCLGIALDRNARLMNAIAAIMYLDEESVMVRARFLLYDEPSVEGVSVDRDTAEMSVGDTLDITATITPGDAFDQSVQWQSSDDSIVSITSGEYESTVTVAALAAGTATVTVTTNDGGYTASCEITVTDNSSAE